MYQKQFFNKYTVNKWSIEKRKRERRKVKKVVTFATNVTFQQVNNYKTERETK